MPANPRRTEMPAGVPLTHQSPERDRSSNSLSRRAPHETELAGIGGSVHSEPRGRLNHGGALGVVLDPITGEPAKHAREHALIAGIRVPGITNEPEKTH